MNENDRLNIFATSNKNYAMDNSSILYIATPDNKKMFGNYIERLNATNMITNHTLVYEEAFKFVRMSQEADLISFNDKPSKIVMLYISHGLTSRALEIVDVLRTIALNQRHLIEPVIINTCAIISGITIYL